MFLVGSELDTLFFTDGNCLDRVINVSLFEDELYETYMAQAVA